MAESNKGGSSSTGISKVKVNGAYKETLLLAEVRAAREDVRNAESRVESLEKNLDAARAEIDEIEKKEEGERTPAQNSRLETLKTREADLKAELEKAAARLKNMDEALKATREDLRQYRGKGKEEETPAEKNLNDLFTTFTMGEEMGEELPVNSKPGMSNGEIAELAKYVSIGAEIERCGKAPNVRQMISSSSDAFVFVDGSSGVGKTQLAFALGDVIYLPLASSQPIYKCFSHITNPLLRFMDLDLCILGEDMQTTDDFNNVLSLESIAQRSLYTVGFLSLLVEKVRTIVSGEEARMTHGNGGIVKSEVPSGTMMQEEVTEAPQEEVAVADEQSVVLQPVISYIEAESKVTFKKETVGMMTLNELECDLPLFVIDEVILNDFKSESRVRFLRNVLRAAKCSPILMGTDSTAANLVDKAQHSRREGLWCSLVTILPPFVNTSFHLGKDETSVFQKLVMKGRPMFAHWFAEKLKESESITLSEMIEYLQNMMLSRKPISSERSVFRSQLRLLNPTNIYSENANDMVKKHYGCVYLKDEPLFLTVNVHGQLEKTDCAGMSREGRVFINSRFPEVADDVLLYLSMMHGKAFCFGGQQLRRYSVRCIGVGTALSKPNPVNEDTLSPNIMANPKSKKVQSEPLEFFASSSMCVATHANGFRGLHAEQFLLHLLWELDPAGEMGCEATDPNMNIDHLYTDDLRSLNIIVPYASPVDSGWPADLIKMDKLLQDSVYFGNIVRPKDSEHVDIKIVDRDGKVMVSGECKNRTTDSESAYNGLSSIEIKKILVRVPSDSKLHIVFCSKMDTQAFTKTNWESFCDDINRPTTNSSNNIVTGHTDKKILGTIRHMKLVKVVKGENGGLKYEQMKGKSRMDLAPKEGDSVDKIILFLPLNTLYNDHY